MDKSVYDFGLRLKTLREEANFTQKQVADRLNVTLSTIQKYENNTSTPPIDNLEKLALLYHTSLDYMRNLTDRNYIYIDDLPPTKQKLILDIVDNIRNEFEETKSTPIL